MKSLILFATIIIVNSVFGWDVTPTYCMWVDSEFDTGIEKEQIWRDLNYLYGPIDDQFLQKNLVEFDRKQIKTKKEFDRIINKQLRRDGDFYGGDAIDTILTIFKPPLNFVEKQFDKTPIEYQQKMMERMAAHELGKVLYQDLTTEQQEEGYYDGRITYILPKPIVLDPVVAASPSPKNKTTLPYKEICLWGGTFLLAAVATSVYYKVAVQTGKVDI